MAATAEAASLHLTVLPQAAGLTTYLTDLRLLARLESIATPPSALLDLQRRFECCSSAGPDGEAGCEAGRPAAVHAAGGQLLANLLPSGASKVLQDAAPCALCLQLGESVASVPWEFLWDGNGFLGEKFQVSRRIVADDAPAQAPRQAPGRGPMKVLILAGGAAAAPAATRLNAGLRSMAGLAVSAVHTRDLPREELLRLIASTDVVHYVGRVDGRIAPSGSVLWWWEGEPLDIASIAALHTAPRLLVSQSDCRGAGGSHGSNLAVALGACRAGLNILTCEAGCAANDAFMLDLYEALARGTAAAEAVRAARVAYRALAGVPALAALRPELHGDGALVVSERRASVDDNLRQVTIVSIDLAGSTRLLNRLGAEKYSDLLSRYHERCLEILHSHGGAPDDFQGDDGGMCYFGTPVAREDAAAQALQAGLELLEAVQALGLHVRIGVCTGQVVVRDGQPVGAAIHLAARLQSIASPGTIVVGDSTRRIVKDRFHFELLQEGILLKGFEEPQVCHRLLGPALPPATHADAARAMPVASPLVGRQEELQALQAHWSAATGGALRIVRILGEAGIGKSRLVQEFKQFLGGAGHQVFECRCSSEHANSAFHPLIDTLRQELRLGADQRPESVVARLRELGSRRAAIDEPAVALLADLLSLRVPMLHPVLEQSAERRRELTVELLVTLARQRVQDAPGCLIVEDIHWLDPSTAEFLDRLASATRDMPLLILVTARPDANLSWRPKLAVYETELQGLSPQLSRALVLSVCGSRRLPGELVQRIADRADGVPLFVEESARMALEVGGDATELDLEAVPVPATVLDLLTARLDRLGAAKQVAQAGAAIGREFPLALLAAVLQEPGSPIRLRDVTTSVAELVRAGMLVSRDDGGGVRLAFRHVLMRDAAYGSLLARDRLRLHQVIAGVIREGFEDLGERQPELLAFHYTEAGMDAQALRFWESAARKAAARSAHAEAISHVASALAVLGRLPPGEEQRRLELRLQLLLAARLLATRGYGAERVERAYARAMELARLLGDEAAEMRALLGLESWHFMRARFEEARGWAVAAAASARRTASGFHQAQTRWALANIRMHQGDMAAAVREMDACRAECQRLEHRPEAVQDPGVMCLCYSAWSLWQLGFPDEARDRVQAVVAQTEATKHQFSLAEAYGFHAAVLHFRGEHRDALASAERAVAICEEHGFAVWLAHARVMRGRIAAELGDVAGGIEEMRQGYESWADSGAVVTIPFYLAMRAEGLALARRHEDGLALLEQALDIVNRTGERYYEAEIRRLIGTLGLRSARRARLDRSPEAEDWLLQALACARSRQLASHALRAALDLGELWQAQGQGARALQTLAPACDAIRGGAGTRDVVAARERLASLRERAGATPTESSALASGGLP